MSTVSTEKIFINEDADDVMLDEPMSPNHSMSRTKSIATVEGFEGKTVVKDQYAGRSLGVFTSGGDAQGFL